MGPSSDANIRAVITADDRASKSLKGFSDNVDHMGHRIGQVAKVAAVALAAATAGAVALGVSSVKAYMESENVLAQLNATLKSTGGIAGVTASDVTKLATSLQRVTRFSDEAIMGGQNLLLTFTKIGKDIFPEATEVMLDMSTALGQDVKSSAIQLGKALQDPILGVTALRRVGVNFNEEAKETIRNFVETNRHAEAQAFILKELQVEFGGSARAAGKTFAGQLDILKNSLNDVQETIGFVIVRALTPFAVNLSEVLTKLDWQALINNTLASLAALWQRLSELANQIFSFLAPSLRALWATISEQLIPALERFWREVIQPMIPVIGVSLVLAVNALLNVLNALLLLLFPLINFLSQNKEAVWLLVGAFVALKGVLLITGVINAVTVSITAMGSGMTAATLSTLGLKATLTSMALPGVGAFAIFATAAVAAFMMVRNAALAMHDAVNNAMTAVENAGIAQDQAIRKIKNNPDLTPEKKGQLIRNLYGHLQHGGTALGGKPYMVGEAGPELFVPKQTGTVVPNDKLAGQMNITIQAGAFMGTQLEARKFAKLIMDAYTDLAASKNKTPVELLS